MKKWDKLIFLCRHLPTLENETGIIMGRLIDPSINWDEENNFRKNIKQFAKFTDIERSTTDFFSSPALRCQQTLKIALSELGFNDLKYKVDKRLWETDCGSFSGKNAKQLRIENAKLLDLWVEHPDEMKFPGGESYSDVQLRTLKWLKEALKKEARIVFVVTHVDVIKMAIFSAVNISISSKRLVTIDPGSITVLGVRGDETVLLNSNLFGGVM